MIKPFCCFKSEPVGEGGVIRHVLGLWASATREWSLEGVWFEQRTQAQPAEQRRIVCSIFVVIAMKASDYIK